jgi:hypothetical protein
MYQAKGVITMSTQILRGSKREIAESVAQIPGEVREAIVFIEEPLDGKGHTYA